MVGVFLIELDPLPNFEVDFNNRSHKIDSINNSSVSTEGKSKKPKFDWKKLLPPPLIGFLWH